MSDTNGAGKPQPLDDWFLDLLACPGCEEHHPVKLNEKQDALLCACGKYSFPVRDGLPILLIDEATVLNTNADPKSLPAARSGEGAG